MAAAQLCQSVHQEAADRAAMIMLSPVALTSIVMKVFERLLKNHICSSIPVTLDPLQFAYRPNRSTDEAISQVLHSSLAHIDSKNGNYVRLLFIDYSSVLTHRPRPKFFTLWLDSRLPHWQTSSGENGPVPLQLHHPECRSPTGLCPESPALLSLHTQLRVLSQLHFYWSRSEQIQVPWGKHLQGPDLDCTHSNTC